MKFLEDQYCNSDVNPNEQGRVSILLRLYYRIVGPMKLRQFRLLTGIALSVILRCAIMQQSSPGEDHSLVDEQECDQLLSCTAVYMV